MYTVVHAVDIFQTRAIKRNNQFEEENFISKNMSANETTIFMITEYGLVYMLADRLPKYRTVIIIAPLALGTICVLHNFSINVRF